MAGSVSVRAFLVIAMGLIPALAAAQGLGGAARQEADRRAQVQVEPAEVRSYTNADLRVDEVEEAGDGDSTREESSEQAAASAPGSRADLDRLREQLDRASARRKEREQKWRARAASARARLAAAEKEHDVACNPGSIALRGG